MVEQVIITAALPASLDFDVEAAGLRIYNASMCILPRESQHASFEMGQ
jgi:hypothetical protein